MASTPTAHGLHGHSADQQPLDKYVPVYSDNTPIKWPAGSNPAHLPGILHEIGRFFTRKGHFIALLENNAVTVGTKLAVEHISSVKFVTGLAFDPMTYGYESPCPPTEARIRAFDARATASKTQSFSRDAPPPEVMSSYTVMPYAIREEKGRLLSCLNNIFEDADVLEQYGEIAAGDGVALLTHLRAVAAKAKPRDFALVEGDLNTHVQIGIIGEVTLDSFNLFMRTFDRLHRLAPNKMTQGQQVSMISNIMYADPAIRERHEDKVSASPPTDRDSAVELVRDMLRGRLVAAQIDERRRSGMTAGHQAMAAQHRALVGTPDATKDKVAPPRDKDGRVTKWIPGMAPCKCGANHLYSDPGCPLNIQGQEGAAEQQQAATTATRR